MSRARVQDALSCDHEQTAVLAELFAFSASRGCVLQGVRHKEVALGIRQQRTKRGHGVLEHQHLAAIVLHDCVCCLQCGAQRALHLHAIRAHLLPLQTLLYTNWVS